MSETAQSECTSSRLALLLKIELLAAPLCHFPRARGKVLGVSAHPGQGAGAQEIKCG